MRVLPKVLTIDWSTWTQNRLENCNNSNGPVTPPYFLETVRKSRKSTDSPETRVIVVNAITGLCMQFRSRLTKSVTIPQSYNWFLFSFPPPLVAQRLRELRSRSKFERVRQSTVQRACIGASLAPCTLVVSGWRGFLPVHRRVVTQACFFILIRQPWTPFDLLE